MILQSRDKLADIVGHLGKQSFIRPPFNASLGCNVWIGDHVVVNTGSVVQYLYFHCEVPCLWFASDQAQGDG